MIFIYFMTMVKNEYNYCINLEKLAFWLDMRKDNLKTLLESNFHEDEDYSLLNENKIGKGKGKGKDKGGNNTKTIMLSYVCAKLLCMISKSEKSKIIRKFYIDLEKLMIIFISKYQCI